MRPGGSIAFPFSEKGRIFVGELGCNTMKRLLLAYGSLAWGLLTLTLVAGCTAKKTDETPQFAPPSLVVTVERGEDVLEAVISCEVSSTLGLMEFGFIWDGQEIIPPGGIVNKVFSVRVGGLEFGSSYTYSAFVGNGLTRIYSEKGVWTTESEVPPAPAIMKTVAFPGSEAGLVRATCRLQGMDLVVQKEKLRCGICYSRDNADPTLEDFSQAADEISPEGDFKMDIKGLTPGTTYYFRPYAAIDKEISYGTALAVKIPATGSIVVTEDCDPFLNRVVMRGRVAVDWAPSLSSYGIDWDGHLIPAAGLDQDGLFSVERGSLTPGNTYSYRAYAEFEGMFYYGEPVSFKTPDFEPPQEEYVDLGLSVYWAVKNLGASSYRTLGGLYAWGETTPKTNFTWENYRWCDGTSQVTKYNSSDQQVLLPEDDAASVALQGSWRMPTMRECQELLRHCQFVYCKTSSMVGFIVTSQVEGYQDKSIFLPIESEYGFAGAEYWSSSVVESTDASRAYIFRMNYLPGGLGNSIDLLSAYRCFGNYIRPVKAR